MKNLTIALLVSLLLGASARAEEPPAIVRGPYLQLATPHSITIVWRSDRAIEPVVRYGARIEDLHMEEADAFVLRVSPVLDHQPLGHFARLHSAPPNTHQYEMTLMGLKPDTRYFYSIWDGEMQLAGGDERHRFRTHPPVGASGSTRIWVVGDSGNGTPEQAAVYRAAREFVADSDKPLDLYLHVGDMAYTNGRDVEFQQNFFDVYQPTLQNTVVWAAMGNHEGYSSNGKTEDGPFYDAYVSPTGGEAGGVPSGTEAYFSFDYGNIHFICLDSHDLSRFPDGLMARWLEQDLRATEADWLIAYWHHPPYTKGTHDSDVELRQIEMREQIMPILEARGVDVVLTGHSHVYERSMLIDGAYSTPTTNVGVVLDDGDGHRDGDGAYRKSDGLNEHEGTAQIVTGHGGAGGVRRSGVMPIMRQTLLEHGSMIIDIEGDTLTSRMIGASGEIRDEFNLVKKGRVRPQVVEQPWSPVGPRFEPLGGPFPDGPVELSQSGYWAGAEIRYTVDGSEPTRHSELYTEPIVVSRDSGLVVLRARSFKDRKTQPTLSTQAIYKAYGADVPQARHPIVVDGEFDDWAQWQGEVIALGGDDFLGRSETWTDARDLSASVRLSWTPEGLYYAVSVVDDIYLPATHDMVVQSDSLMFMVDGRGPRHLSGPSLGHGAYRVMFAGNASGDGHRSVSYLPEFDGYEFATQRTADGYDAEFFVPFSEKLFPDQGFEVGRVIQASVVVVEHDEPGFTGVDGLYWGAVADWNIRTDPSFWKPMRLGE